MSIRNFRLLLITALLVSHLSAEAIHGTILIEKKLTRRSVTSSVSMYQRGPSIQLGKDEEEDPLAFERGRVVIYIEGPGPLAPVSGKMEQVGRRFSPDLVVVPVGSTVSFPNMDPIFHNVFSLSKPKSFDLGNYPRGDSRSVAFNKPGVAYVDCRLHPNMAGTIMVTPNSWSTRSDRDGRFAILDIPPGEYTVVAWHKAVGFFRKQVRITNGNDASLEFFLPIGTDTGKTPGAH